MTTVPPLIEAIEQQSKNQPDGVALIDDREQVTWAEFARRIAASAAGLEKLGLEAGERIGIHGLNSTELAVTMLGCWRRGLITVLLTPGSKGFEVQQELAATGAVAYVGDPDLYPVGQTALRNCPALRLAMVLHRGALLPEVAERLSGNSPGGTEPAHPRDLAAILFSSGTTGIPKGVMHTHASLAAMGRFVKDVSECGSKALVAPPLSCRVRPWKAPEFHPGSDVGASNGHAAKPGLSRLAPVTLARLEGRVNAAPPFILDSGQDSTLSRIVLCGFAASGLKKVKFVLTAADRIEIRYTSAQDIDTVVCETFQKVLAASGAANAMHVGVKRVHDLPLDPRTGKFRITQTQCPDR